MQITPKSEETLKDEEQKRAEAFLWPDGEADFEILDGFDTRSNSGNDMIKLSVKVFNDQGNTQNIFDYLMESFAFKLRHAAYSCGLGSDYEKGQLNGEDFIGKTGKLLISTQKAQNGYAARNIIKDYLLTDEQQVQRTQAKNEQARKEEIPFDDTIPF